MQLYKHQQDIINDDPHKALLALGCGGGKTLISLLLARGKTLVICQKQQAVDKTFENTKEKFNLTNCELIVFSKEQFKIHYKELITQKFDTIILDEVHRVANISSNTKTIKGIKYPKSSQLFEKVSRFIVFQNPSRLYLLSATPASKPLRVYAIATLLGHKWDYFAFREKYYYRIPLGFGERWEPRKKPELKEKLTSIVKAFGYTGGLNDWFDVPEQTHVEEYLSLTKEQITAIKSLKNDLDPLALNGQMRAIENGINYTYETIEENGFDVVKRITKTYKNEKLERIIEIAEEFPRVLIFARYTAQIEMIANALKKEGYKVYTLTGKTKDRGTMLKQADNEDCIVIAQASIAEGYELKTFRTVVFASKSHSVEDYIQAQGRNLRQDALYKNLYIHLIVKGGADERCHKSILEGKDFMERIME